MDKYKLLIKEFLSEQTKSHRKKSSLSQEEMAEQLKISARSYSDLERGKYCFSARSLIFWFLYLDKQELFEFQQTLRQKINQLDNE